MHVRGQGVLVQEEEDTPGEQQDEADILISALGILEVIRCPDIPGLDTFKGNIFHSGAWDHTVELKGKRVGVIGNGASATQFIPIISKDPSVKVTVICRTPNWFVPPIRAKYSTLRKWMFRNVPLFMRLHRLYYFLITDMFYMSVFANVWIRKLARRVCKAYILSTAPKKYHDKLIPSYTLGCKRVIFDTNYLNCLHRPNVDLNWNEIGSIIEDGIITKTGDKLPFEVLIFATGFISDDYPLHVKGTLETVKEFYDRNGGPTAYMGTTLPGFPNFYMLTGPNTGTGHTSVIFTEECQIDYMLQMIKPVLRGDLKTVEVTDKATARWNDKIQARLRRSVFVDCVSWYRRDRDGKVTSIFPGFATVFWWWFRRVNWRDYRVSARDPTQWERKQNQKEQWRGFKKVAVFFAVLSISIAILAKGAGKWDFVLDVCTKHLPSSSCPLYRRAKALWGF
ncbi:hypothetical protein E1B28_003911 [Marasmius oreades]|nr:uncharacterized protein E1B28_003911 [Marasmius oreades]KAG7096480.1 hypothetical protein E1B28_003911 [Marasmius oreades]